MIELPVLDDKRFRQILDEAVARIPTLTDQWTDYNPQDTGIMLLELLAAMTEMQNFYLDQVGNRFYQKYLELVNGPPSDETMQVQVQVQIERFARQCAQIDVAVTAKDYEQLLLSSPFSIERAKAAVDNGFIRLTVFRRSGSLNSVEMAELRDWLESYRLLTVRLKIEQAVCLPVDIICRVALDTKLGRENVCREKLKMLFGRLIREKDIGEEINFNGVRAEILSMPEVTRIDTLSIRRDETNLPSEVKRENILLQVKNVEISFAQ